MVSARRCRSGRAGAAACRRGSDADDHRPRRQPTEITETLRRNADRQRRRDVTVHASGAGTRHAPSSISSRPTPTTCRHRPRARHLERHVLPAVISQRQRRASAAVSRGTATALGNLCARVYDVGQADRAGRPSSVTIKHPTKQGRTAVQDAAPAVHPCPLGTSGHPTSERRADREPER